MKKTIVAVAIVLSVATAFAASVMGKWKFSYSQQGYTQTLVLDLAADSVGLAANCAYNGTEVAVNLVVKAKVSETELELLETKEVKDSKNGVNCQIQAQQGQKLGLAVSADDQKLTLTDTASG